jgi:hypothetical protein
MSAEGEPGLLQRKKRPPFPRFAPDFVVELRFPDDRLSRLRSKMSETLLDVETVAGEGPVEGFVLDLRPVWDPAGL